MTNKILSLFLSIVMLLSITAGLDFSVYALESGSYEYSVSEDNATITKYTGSATNVTIPSKLDGYTVTKIGNEAFYNCSNLTSVKIPNTITSIGIHAFYNCSNLKSLTIPNSVTNISWYAFHNCTSLTSVTLGNGLTGIRNGTFYNCTSLSSITIGNSVTSIGYAALSNCTSLTSIKLPSGITSIGDEAFYKCTSLTSIIIPNSVTSIGNKTFDYCSSLKNVFYSGSKTQWQNISIGSNNSYLTDSKIHYNSTGAHTWNGGTVTKQPTCVSTGTKTYYCTQCSATRTETIKATGVHTYNKTIAKATTSKNGSIVNKCSKCSKSITQVIYFPKTISLSAYSYTYDGKVKTPSVTVKDSKGKTLKNNTDYTVSYASGRKSAGRYSVKITFKGNYSGTVTKTFDIKPKASKVSSISSPQKKSIAIDWKSVSSISGYEIQVSTSSNFSKNIKTYTAKASSKSALIKKYIKGKTKYFVRIRTFKTVKYNGKKVNVYSSWSSAKSIKTKG